MDTPPNTHLINRKYSDAAHVLTAARRAQLDREPAPELPGQQATRPCIGIATQVLRSRLILSHSSHTTLMQPSI
jgi:hypothetical protein